MRTANVLSEVDIHYLLDLPEVRTARTRIDSQTTGSVYFTAPLPSSLKTSLYEQLGLNLSNVDAVPMRWMKGDLPSHVDQGANAFENTYLVYLTNSQGSLVLDEHPYPIVQGQSYVFPEGVSHKTVGTGTEPRLLLGPMSEAGFAVGASTTISQPGGVTVYIQETSGGIEYSQDNRSSWLSAVFQITIQNTNTSLGVVKIEFDTNLTFTNTGQFFICGSSYIQFGSTSLTSNGSRPVITIATGSYDGLIENGTNSGNGQSNIYVYNLIVNGSGYNPQIGAGWIGKSYFGKGATNNYFINCSSVGDLPAGAIGSGGIVGSYAGAGTGTPSSSSLFLYGCSSSGTIEELDGGIVGAYAGNNGGSVTCEQCWSTGVIQDIGGGIFGDYAGDGGYVLANKCYTSGSLGNNSGGIFGRYAGNAGQAVATNCYSLGNIAIDGGGIFGLGAGSSEGTSSATNCYSAGTVATTGNGIYGTGKVTGTETNCYVANGSWNTTTANTNLTGVPTTDQVGTTWVATVLNQPYELNNMGYTPYTLTIISASPALVKNYSTTVTAGQSSSSAIINDKTYAILKLSGGDSSSYGTISINSVTGAISTTTGTVGGVYTLVIRNLGSYNITTFSLTVENNTCPNCPICFPAGTPVLTDQGEVAIEKIDKNLHTIRGKKIVAIVESIPLDSYLICIDKHSLGPNVPSRRTFITKDHKVMYQNKLVKSEELMREASLVYKVPYNKHKVYNVLLKEHSLMAVNNLIVETLHPTHRLAKINMECGNPSEKMILIQMVNNYNILKMKEKERSNQVKYRNFVDLNTRNGMITRKRQTLRV